MSFSNFLFGTPERFEQRSTLTPQQQPVLNNLIQSTQAPGAGGLYGSVTDYYRNLLSPDSSQVQAMAAPEMRTFNQQILPNITSQFSGLGAGGALSGSGLRNAILNSSTDLLERIAAIRANYASQGAQGLQNIGQSALGNYTANIFRPRAPGLLENIPAIIGAGASGAAGGGFSSLMNWLKNLNTNRNTVTGVQS